MMSRNLDFWLIQLEKELRWLPQGRKREILTELGGDLAEADTLPDHGQLASEILRTELQLVPAAYWQRALAFGLDFILVLTATALLIFPLALLPDPPGIWWLAVVPLALGAVSSVVLWFPCFEAVLGRTPGKMLMKLAVVGEDGRPCSWGQAWIRRIPFLANALLVIDAVFMFFLPKRQRAFDKVARTVVIHDPQGGRKND